MGNVHRTVVRALSLRFQLVGRGGSQANEGEGKLGVRTRDGAIVDRAGMYTFLLENRRSSALHLSQE